MVPLVNLDPQFVGAGGEGITNADGSPVPQRRGIGLSFKCPCGKPHDEYDRIYVSFKNPLDGKGPYDVARPIWQRTGETFETLVLSPSILRRSHCGWHGFIGGPDGSKPGMVTTC